MAFLTIAPQRSTKIDVNNLMFRKSRNIHSGISFHKLNSNKLQKSLFESLFSLFQQLFLITSGDINAVFQWMNELDKRFSIFNKSYRLPDFIKELENKQYIRFLENTTSIFKPTSKLEVKLRQNTFESLFGKLRKGRPGKHKTRWNGIGEELSDELKSYEFGDSYQNINSQETVKNALIRHGAGTFQLQEEDLVAHNSQQQSQCSTILMIDISHSMILYGEDRITPAKKVSMALSHMIQKYYPKDKLRVIVFGDDAREIKISELPYLEAGPYHTNTIAGIQLAIELLNKDKCLNKHIMMITDGKPTCIKRGKEYYKNPYGLDEYIIKRTLSLARKCRKLNIEMTTFMLADDPYLIDFVERFSNEARGKAFYTNLDGLGQHILINYENQKRKKSK